MKASKEKSSSMVRITISLPRTYVEHMEMLVSQRLYHSKGEIIQAALRELLIREAGLNGESVIRLRKSEASH